MRVDNNVWAYAAVDAERHVHIRVQQAQRSLLPVTRTELITDDGVAIVAELHRHLSQHPPRRHQAQGADCGPSRSQ
eukprot:1094228-Pyramimonas_sp.AAC.1